MKAADIQRSMEIATRVARQFDAVSKASRQLGTVRKVSRFGAVPGASRHVRDVTWAGPVDVIPSFQRQATWKRAVAHQYLTTRAVTHHGPLPAMPRTWEPQTYEELWRRVIRQTKYLDFQSLLSLYRHTGSYAAPRDPRDKGKPIIVLTGRDRLHCPYVAGLLRASGWRVIELRPFESIHIFDPERMPASWLNGIERPTQRRFARRPAGRRRRHRDQEPECDETRTRPIREHLLRQGDGGAHPGRVPHCGRDPGRPHSRASVRRRSLRRGYPAPARGAALPHFVA